VTERLHVGVMGAGSIGCYVGGKLLAHESAEVTLVGRERGKNEIAAHGLAVRGLEGSGEHVEAARVHYTTEVSELAPCDVVLVCVKSAQTAEVGRDLARVLSDDALVVSFQNGVSNASALREHFGAARVVPAIVGFNVVGRGEGVFHRGTDGPIVLEDRGARHLTPLIRALEAAGLDVESHREIGPHQWTKLLVNLNNAVSALSGAPTQELLRSAGYRRIVAAVMGEGVRVLSAAGIRPAPLRGVPVGLMPRVLRLPDPIVRLITSAQMKVDPEARSSMWEDLSRRRGTEVDYLNGEIVSLAERHGVEAPLNTRIVALVRAAEAAGAGSPGLGADALWAALTS